MLLDLLREFPNLLRRQEPTQFARGFRNEGSDSDLRQTSFLERDVTVAISRDHFAYHCAQVWFVTYNKNLRIFLELREPALKARPASFRSKFIPLFEPVHSLERL